MRISDWSSDVCSSDLLAPGLRDDVRLHLVMARVEDAVRHLLLFEKVREQLRFFDRDGADQHRLAAFGVEFDLRSEEHTSELQSLMRISYAVFCLKKKNKTTYDQTIYNTVTNKYQ